MAEVAAGLPDGVDHDVIAALLARITASQSLRRSERLKDFLNYICKQALEGKLDQLTESHLAVNVFGRRPTYDPSSDNVVRVQARFLRQKLADYFAGEGVLEPVIIEIPKGGYVPVFVNRHASGPAPETQSRRTMIAGRKVPLSWLVLLAGIAVILLAGCGWLLLQNRTLRQEVAGTPSSLASLVFEPGKPAFFVVPDTGLVIAQVLTGKHFSLDKYAGVAYRNELFTDPTLQKPREFWGYLTARQFTDISTTTLLGKIVRQLPRTAKDLIQVHHPRTIRLADFKGKNAMLVGSPRSNPWVEAFHDQLAFRFHPDATGAGEVITNVSPLGSEPSSFSSDPLLLGSGKNVGYVGLIPNPNPPGRILIIGGSGAAATEALAEVVTDPIALSRLESSINVPALGNVRKLEVVLSVQVIGGAPNGWQVLAHRVAF